MSEWIEWKGGKCPVHPLTKVELRLRGGFIMDAEEAGLSPWAHREKSYDIIAYRVVKEKEA